MKCGNAALSGDVSSGEYGNLVGGKYFFDKFLGYLVRSLWHDASFGSSRIASDLYRYFLYSHQLIGMLVAITCFNILYYTFT